VVEEEVLEAVKVDDEVRELRVQKGAPPKELYPKGQVEQDEAPTPE
jgi:hypothetical protein